MKQLNDSRKYTAQWYSFLLTCFVVCDWVILNFEIDRNGIFKTWYKQLHILFIIS